MTTKIRYDEPKFHKLVARRPTAPHADHGADPGAGGSALNCEPEVVLHVACGVMAGETYPQIETSFREAGVRISEDEAEIATGYVIRFLTHVLRERPEEVADFCVESGLPIPRDDVFYIARKFQQENESSG